MVAPFFTSVVPEDAANILTAMHNLIGGYAMTNVSSPVQNSKTPLLRMLSLCSGIGAIDLAAEMTKSIEVAGQVEIDPFCQKVLAKHWPDVKRMSDIKEVVGNEFGTIDIVAGGIPCQPFSNAGKRRGTEDDRHLWPYAFSIIKVAQPTWVVIENVAGFVDLALDLVASDLESQNYTVQAYVLPACAIGAPHYRQRCFVVAHSSSCRLEVSQTPTQFSTQLGSSSILPNAYSDRCGIWQIQQELQQECKETPDTGHDGPQELMAHTRSTGWAELNVATITSEQGHVARRTRAPGNVGQFESGICRANDGRPNWLDRFGQHRWPALPGQSQYEYEPPRTIATRVPNHSQRLKALGNAVVPQQIYPLFQYIAQFCRQGEAV